MQDQTEWTSPTWWYIHTTPETDEQYFENLTRCIFHAGLNWQVITNKWPHFQTAFQKFNISKVANYQDSDVHELLQNAQIVRNKRKIEATIYNAQEFTRIAKDYGTFEHWLDQLDKSNNYRAVVQQLMKQFKHVGKMTAHTFLHSVGEKIQHDVTVCGNKQ